MTDPRQDSTPDEAEQVSPHALSAALAALGAYDRPLTCDQLDAAERAEGRRELIARLSNALYGAALAQVIIAEIDVVRADSGATCRREAWRAARATGPDTSIMMQYTAQRLGDELHAIGERLPVDIGVVGAARRAAQAAALLLEVTTIDSPADPRKDVVFAHLTHAGTLLTEAADQITSLCATISDLAGLLTRPGSGSAGPDRPNACS